MPRGWSMFGTSDEEAGPTHAQDTHDQQDTASTNVVLQDPIASTVSTDGEVIEGGNFPCIIGAPIAVPSSSDMKLPPAANSLPGWSAIDFKRNDSASSIELTGGDFPSLSSMIDASAAMSSPSAVKNSTPSRSCPGLPPPAPRSPLALTFSRRGGRPLNNANTAVTKNGSPATSPSKTRMLVGADQQGSPRAVGSSKLPTNGRGDNQSADSESAESAAELIATTAAALSARESSGITRGDEAAASTTTFAHEYKIAGGSFGSGERGVDATEIATASPSSTLSLGPSSFTSLSFKQIVVGGDEYSSSERSALGNGSVASVEQQRMLPQPPLPSSKSIKSLHQRAPSAVNPLSESQLAPFVKKSSAPKFSAPSLSCAGKLLAASSAGYAGTITPETTAGSATAQAPSYGSSAHSQAKSGVMMASAKPAALSGLGATNPLPPLSTSSHQQPAMNAPSSATAGAALGQPWSGTTPVCAVGTDGVGGGNAVAGVYDPATAGGGSGRVLAPEESEANTRDSSQRASSFSVNSKSLAGRGFLGCFPRRAPAQEQPNARALPTHPASFRLMRSSSKTATPTGTPKATPGRFRVKKRPSFGRQQSQEGRVSPPVPVMDLPPRSTRQRTRGASDATAVVEDKSPEVVVSGEDVVKGVVGGGADRRGKEEAKVGERQANVGQGEGVAEEDEEAEAIVAETVRMRGSLECGRAMRMDGIFVGQLLSTGSITVGSTGHVTGDLKGLKLLCVEGHVVGDVVCDNVMVLNRGKIYGDITAVSLTIGAETTVRGKLNVVSDASSLSEAANSSNNPNAAATAENHTNQSATTSDEADQSEAADAMKVAGTGSQRTSFEPSVADKLDDDKRQVEKEKVSGIATESDSRGSEGEAEEKAEVRPISPEANEEETLIEKAEIDPDQFWSSDEEEGEITGEVQAVVISPEKRQDTEETMETSIETANETERKCIVQHDSCASVVQVTMYQQATKDGATATSSDTDFASDDESAPVSTLKQPVLATEGTTAIEPTSSPTAPTVPDIASPVLPESGRKSPEAEGGSLFSKHGEGDDESIHVLSEEYSSAGSVEVSSGSGDELM